MSMSPMSPMSWPMSPISPMSWPMSPMSWLMSPMSWPMSPMSGWVQVGELGTPLPSLLPDTGKIGLTIYHMWPHATTCDHVWTICDHYLPTIYHMWPHATTCDHVWTICDINHINHINHMSHVVTCGIYHMWPHVVTYGSHVVTCGRMWSHVVNSR